MTDHFHAVRATTIPATDGRFSFVYMRLGAASSSIHTTTTTTPNRGPSCWWWRLRARAGIVRLEGGGHCAALDREMANAAVPIR